MDFLLVDNFSNIVSIAFQERKNIGAQYEIIF